MTAWSEKRDLPWAKVWADWFTSLSHAELGVVTLGIGVRCMQLANQRGRREDGSGALVGATGGPLSSAVIAQQAHATVEQVEVALAELVAVGTLEEHDGYLVFPRLQRYQEDPATERKRRERDRLSERGPGEVVYVLRRRGEGDPKQVKIGWTKNLLRRVKDLEQEVGPVDVLATTPGDQAVEASLHERFRGDRIERSEWFRYSPAIVAFIADLDQWTSGHGQVTRTRPSRKVSCSRVEVRGQRSEVRRSEDTEEEVQEEGAGPHAPAEAPGFEHQLRRSLEMADELFPLAEVRSEPSEPAPREPLKLALVEDPPRDHRLAPFVAAWNRGRHGSPIPEAIAPGKRAQARDVAWSKATARGAWDDPADWEWCARALAGDPHHRGDNDSGWKADIGWLLERGRGAKLEQWMTRGRELRARGGRPAEVRARAAPLQGVDATAAAQRRLMEENNAKMRAEQVARARAAPSRMPESMKDMLSKMGPKPPEGRSDG